MNPYGPPPWQPPPYPPPSRTPWVGIIVGVVGAFLVFVALAVVGFVMLARRRVVAHYTPSTTTTTSTASGPAWSDADSPVPVTSDDPSWGDRTAPVTIVVFGDLQDPFFARFGPTLDGLQSLYGGSQLRVVWKNNPLAYHANAHDAAEAAEGAFDLQGSSAFWHFEQRALANQLSLGTASYETWTTEAGVDLPSFRSGMAAHKWAPKVDADRALATKLGVYGSQGYVNGIRVSTSMPLATWQKTIDDEMPKARLGLASGVHGDRIYVVRSTDNFATTPVPLPTSTYSPTPSLAVHLVPVGGSPVRGKHDALVTLVEFGDFQCPFCKRAETTVTALRAKYGDDLRVVWKNQPLPFHIHALPAAEVALEARHEKGDAAFWAVHDDLYASSPTLDDAALMRIARDHGVSETLARSAISTNRWDTTITTDTTLAKAVGALGTPTFFVNGRMLSGAQPQASFETLIDEELTKAKMRVSKGTAPSKVYDEIMAGASP